MNNFEVLTFSCREEETSRLLWNYPLLKSSTAGRDLYKKEMKKFRVFRKEKFEEMISILNEANRKSTKENLTKTMRKDFHSKTKNLTSSS